MGILKAGNLRITNRLSLGPNEAYALYQVHDLDENLVVGRIGLTAEQFGQLRELLDAQAEVDEISAKVEPFLKGR